MSFRPIQRILGLLLVVFSLAMLPPVGVSLYYADGTHLPFLAAFAWLVVVGTAVWWPVRRDRQDLRLRHGFIVVTLFWTVLGLAGALPLYISPQPAIGLTDAVFESVSGLTTTGATVLAGLDALPRSILYYRQQMQWLGGMGIVILAVALLPMLGVGGMSLYRAEMPGPVKDAKLTPRITQTARMLWVVYVSITVACAVGYLLAGMQPFDAIGHAFATVAIGGFSHYDASIGHFDNKAVELVAVVFMLVGAMNFGLHFVAWRSGRLGAYWRDPECAAFLRLMLLLCLATLAYLLVAGDYEDTLELAADGIFQAISVATTTGFTTSHYHHWPGALPVLLLFASFVGGCAGSTAGGIKVVRCLLLVKQGRREIIRLVHPTAEIPVQLGGRAVPLRVVDAVWGFFAVYVGVFAVLMLALMVTGVDQVTAFSAIGATINNLGPGLGEVAQNYAGLGTAGKWICVGAMLLGRLEIFTLLILFTVTFWRK
ncbi:MAG: TrkH family potassium uptake protein [Steroidobacteraceae bacterium]